MRDFDIRSEDEERFAFLRISVGSVMLLLLASLLVCPPGAGATVTDRTPEALEEAESDDSCNCRDGTSWRKGRDECGTKGHCGRFAQRNDWIR